MYDAKKLLTLLIEPIGAARQTGPCDRLQTFLYMIAQNTNCERLISLPPFHFSTSLFADAELNIKQNGNYFISPK
jgi:hypothetical protein